MKTQLKADQALKDEAKAELSNEIQEKANKLEQIEKEKTDLQTQFAKADQDKNKALETAKLIAEQDKNKALEDAKKEAEEKQQELQTKLDVANTEKTGLQQQLDNLTKDDTAIEDLFADGSIKTEIEVLIELTGQGLKDKVKGLYDGKLKSTIEDIIGSNLSEMKDEDKGKLHEGLQIKIESIIGNGQSKNADEIVESIKKEELKNSIINASKFSKEVADLKVELEAKEKQIKTLEAEKNKAEQEKQNLEAEKNKAKAQITRLNTEVEKLKKELENKGSEIQKLGEKNKELEAKNKTTEQPKQGNGAKYTATVGMGLAAGLIAFTALERTVRLDMLVMIGIAETSALVVGGITYVALPSTQVDGAKAQEVNENGKKK
ncbi:hypothetical protein [Wolbachia endosymbiont (group A) of Myopa testacea]|uniref:hypothetical protein n=1 Tax=Wolbachia endosymbiont (group A) of Myopa testacea TaxID=3066148 RepID=UPI003341F6F9